jgi:hypothetical protein
MIDMHASCLVTIQPTITPERVGALADRIINQLWPGNAGGVVFLFRGRMAQALAPIVAEVMTRGKPARFRVQRNGMAYTIEPEITAEDRARRDGFEVGA